MLKWFLASRPWQKGGIVLAAWALTACGTHAEYAGLMLKRALPFANAPVQASALDSRSKYLYLDTGAARAFMMLGDTRSDALGPIEYWYGSGGEILALQNGRIVGASGLGVDWKGVRMDLSPDARAYTRSHDELPSHRYGIMTRYSVELAPAVPDEVRAQRQGMAKRIGQPQAAESDSTTLWRIDEPWSGKASDRVGVLLRSVPQGWLAVYGQQCLSETLCLKWYRL